MILVFCSLPVSPLASYLLKLASCPTWLSLFFPQMCGVKTGMNPPARSVRYARTLLSDLPSKLTKLLNYFHLYHFSSSLLITKDNLVQPHIPTKSQFGLPWMPLEAGNSVPHRQHAYFQVPSAAKKPRTTALSFPSVDRSVEESFPPTVEKESLRNDQPSDVVLLWR